MSDRSGTSGHQRTEDGENQPPNQTIEREDISREQRVGHGSTKEKSHVHDFLCGYAIGDDQAEKKNPKWREPDKTRPVKKEAQAESDEHGAEGCHGASKNEGEFGAS